MKKKKVIKFGIITSVILVIAIVGWFAYRYFNSSTEREMPAINPQDSIAIVSKGELKETITASGTVALADEFEVYAEGESNIVKEFLVEEGDNVKEGQLLVNYDVEDKKEEYENKIKELEINLQNEKMNLENISLPLSETEKKELENSIAQAEKNVYDTKVKIEKYADTINKQETAIENAKRNIENAKSDYEKAQKTVNDNKELLEAGAITQQEYDNSVDEAKKLSDSYDDAVQALSEAQTELIAIQKDKESDEYSLKNSEMSLSLAQTKLKTASNPMADTSTQLKYKQQQNQITLTQNSLDEYKKKLSELVYSTSSLVSGLVTEICIDEGTYTEENTVMLKIANFNELIVQASIAEYDAPDVQVGQSVIMTTDGIEGKTYTGKIIKVNPSASSATSNMGSETVVPVEISVENPDGILKPGYNLDLEIITADKQDILTVPTSTVLKDSEKDEYYAFVINDDKTIKKTTVKVGIYGETSTEIIEGLNEGDKLILTASKEMKDGMSTMEAIALSNTANTNSKKETDEEEDKAGMMFGGPNGGMGNRPNGGMGAGPR